MPKLFSQSKHVEFEPNSALQIRDQKERRAENAKKLELQEIFAACTVHLAHYSCLLYTVHFSHIVPAARLKFCFLFLFLISSHFVLVTVNCFC